MDEAHKIAGWDKKQAQILRLRYALLGMIAVLRFVTTAVEVRQVSLFAAAFADFYVQALDLLVQRRERDVELLGGVSLVPVAALQFFYDDAALDVFEDVEEGGIGIVFEERVLEAAASDVAGQEFGTDVGAR